VKRRKCKIGNFQEIIKISNKKKTTQREHKVNQNPSK